MDDKPAVRIAQEDARTDAARERLAESARSRRRPGRIRAGLVALAALMGLAVAPPSPAAAPGKPVAPLDAIARKVASQACTAMKNRVDAVPGDAPLLLRSYDPAEGASEIDMPALRTAAFTYDNALAVIALQACGHRAQALRIGAALERAALRDTRLRNTYRAGAAGDKVLANGWWDAAQNRWVEDGYQSGTATGNVAWTALALLALHETTGEARWRDAAAKLAAWVVANTRAAGADGGFSGGVDGFDAAPAKLGWKSSEHAIDLVAVFGRLADAKAAGDWREQAAHARRFLDSQWDEAGGHFGIGTLPDGRTPNRVTSALDVQWWSQMLPDAPKNWRRAMRYAERVHAVGAGFDFNDDRDGEWLEGTAQAALAYRIAGETDAARRCLAEAAAQFSAGGYLFATREPRITTGLAIGPGSTSADAYYYRRPHLGATAWAALAALDRNPFRAQR
ncbi:hypothetical protein [Tahibacter soli]|uniref:Methylaspartate ammonia-lyase n=1 Tax=Tahibacter soli TaxID=2983605 RepID=A0A9X3YMV5_9GAMM|nr:hypothetical protein [Tahibacter soli]MDC8014612.1 hypothetical protein [Tahibacter soli]